MAILDMLDKVRAAWGRRNVALGVFIDLKKELDMVLLTKLDHYGVRGRLWGCWPVYGAALGRGKIETFLGLFFFLIYVSDMVRVSRDLGFVLFADDTNIFAEGRDPIELFWRVNGALGELNRWFRGSQKIKWPCWAGWSLCMAMR